MAALVSVVWPASMPPSTCSVRHEERFAQPAVWRRTDWCSRELDRSLSTTPRATAGWLAKVQDKTAAEYSADRETTSAELSSE